MRRYGCSESLSQDLVIPKLKAEINCRLRWTDSASEFDNLFGRQPYAIVQKHDDARLSVQNGSVTS